MSVSWRGFYAIVDPERCAGRDPRRVAEAVLAASPAVLQLRAKKLSDGDALSLAWTIRGMCARAGVPFVINDRADIAVLCDADGLHLGQDDLPLAHARKVFGGVIGVSTHTAEQLEEAVAAGADLVAYGPIFPTGSKENPDPVVGLEGLARARALAGERPLVAIGGIDPAVAGSIYAAGADLVAAISAVCGAEDPTAAAQDFARPTPSPEPR